MTEVLICVALPFLGTMAGAAMVFFMPRHGRRGELRPGTRGALMGFAAGVMTAASFWSLLIPAIGLSVALGVWAFVPATAGFCLGVALILGLDRLSPYLFRGAQVPGRRGETMLMAAVTLHNLPEGMAVGVACAGLMLANGGTTPAGVLSLSLGIAIQNVPEGAIIALPLWTEGMWKAFSLGTLSGAVEPAGAVLMILMTRWLSPAMPWLLGFAAGAMFCVVVEELIPEMRKSAPGAGTLWFTAGFALMMALDVALG